MSVYGMAQPKYQHLVSEDLDMRQGLTDWEDSQADTERSLYQHSTKPLVVRLHIDDDGEITSAEIVPKNSSSRAMDTCVLELELPLQCNFGRREYSAFVCSHWTNFSHIEQLAKTHFLPLHKF